MLCSPVLLLSKVAINSLLNVTACHESNWSAGKVSVHHILLHSLMKHSREVNTSQQNWLWCLPPMWLRQKDFRNERTDRKWASWQFEDMFYHSADGTYKPTKPTRREISTKGYFLTLLMEFSRKMGEIDLFFTQITKNPKDLKVCNLPATL